MKGILKMKKILALLLSVMLLAGIASAEEAKDDFLGKPFPDFTVTDTEGNSFTLSEALKDHEAVLVNLWATWCPPCEREFPDLNDVYGRYGDRVAALRWTTAFLSRNFLSSRRFLSTIRWCGILIFRISIPCAPW